MPAVVVTAMTMTEWVGRGEKNIKTFFLLTKHFFFSQEFPFERGKVFLKQQKSMNVIFLLGNTHTPQTHTTLV